MAKSFWTQAELQAYVNCAYEMQLRDDPHVPADDKELLLTALAHAAFALSCNWEQLRDQAALLTIPEALPLPIRLVTD
jgi:hypothetical protein